jgi:hypothetical protein
MQKPLMRRISTLAVGTVAATLVVGSAFAAPGASTGPSSSDSPYLVPHAPGVTVKSVLTTGDSVGGYRMAGTPDGLGAFDNGDGTFTVLMNHEFRSSLGIARAHGGTGSFVSKWVIDKETLQVRSGSDLIQRGHLSTEGGYVETPNAAMDRFCSADLPARTALFNPATGKGYDGPVFLNGEETSGGRAFAHVVNSGDSYEVPGIGKAAFENVVANPASGDKTVVIGLSDTGGGKLKVYVGDKKTTGSPVDKAGLTGGQGYEISVPDMPSEDSGVEWTKGALPFTLAPGEGGGSGFARPEDGAWDPNHPNDFYFVTTAGFDKHSRLFRLRFEDVTNPAAGGALEMMVEGPADTSADSAGPKMMDNLTINDRGQVLIQEDPGSQTYLAGIYQYDIATGNVRRIADHDPERFLPGGASFDTTNEESSGIIPAPFLGAGKYLADVQNHTKVTDPELVEKGQLVVLSVPLGQPVK